MAYDIKRLRGSSQRKSMVRMLAFAVPVLIAASLGFLPSPFGVATLSCGNTCDGAMANLPVASVLAPEKAWAEDINTNPQADELQQEVERTASEYEDALSKVEEAEKALKDNRARINKLEKEIPEQQSRSDAAARELYKIEQQSGGIVELLLSCDSFYDFLNNIEYASRVSQANMDEIERLGAMKAEMDETQAALKQAKVDADSHAEEAKAALDAAQEARREAQRRAQEEARRQAEEAAARAAAAQQAAAAAAQAQAAAAEKAEKEKAENPDDADGEVAEGEASDKSADTAKEDDGEAANSKDSDSKDSEAKEEEPEPVEDVPVSLDPVSNDGADWTAGQEAFVNEWAPRIDAYLEGSPMGGQGKTFANAAWSYGVDPRWSPAISCVESSKGAACFRSHNAWGWGSESWGSWEEAIDAHVRGLARGYGYTLTVDAALTYCPPNWKHWYERTRDEMNVI